MNSIDDMDGSDLTYEQLRVFVAVATEEHVTEAARQVGLSQPAASHHLKALQRALGLALFERAGRGIRLSEDGRALLPMATAALRALRGVEEAAAARCGLVAGNLVLAASNTIGVYRVPTWLAGYLQRYPGMDVRVRLVNTIEALRLLREGAVDCALIEAPAPTDGLDELPVASDELVVVAAARHPLARLAKVGVDDLRRHRYLAREPGSGTEVLAMDLLGTAYRCGPVVELGHVDAVRTAALAGLGYAVLPLAAVGECLVSGQLARLNIGRPSLKRTFRACRRPTSHSPGLQAFWDHLVSISDIQPSPLNPAPSTQPTKPSPLNPAH